MFAEGGIDCTTHFLVRHAAHRMQEILIVSDVAHTEQTACSRIDRENAILAIDAARTAELQELTKQHRMEQLQLASVLERYPHYIMVLHADDLTIQSVNPNYKQLLGGRDVNGIPMSEVFNGREVDHLLKALKTAARETQTLNTGPIFASVDGDNPDGVRFIHTVVPISDASGSNVTRLFLYSEKVE